MTIWSLRNIQPFSDAMKNLPDDGKQRYIVYVRNRQGWVQASVHDVPYPPMDRKYHIVSSMPLPRVTATQSDHWNPTGEVS